MRETLPRGGHRLYDFLVARRLMRFYRRLLPRFPDGDLLDVGCGPGHLAAALAHHHPDARVVGVDLDPVQVRLARRYDGPTFLVGASHALPLPDHSQDQVVATGTYHHWVHPRRSLDEIHRVLRPGGVFLLIEGAGDMTRPELEAWTGRRAWPGLTPWVRAVFRRHGYTSEALRRDVLPLLEASLFDDVDVQREDGWWVITMRP